MSLKRLSKALAEAGVDSRRKCEELIFAGRIKVNGAVVLKPETRVLHGKDKITIDDVPLKEEKQKFYFLLNKPVGFICSNKREGRKKLVIDLFSKLQKRLFTVGRLDKNTSGLIIVTNDGDFAQKVIHPSFNIVKEYLVKVASDVSHQDLVTLSNGSKIEGKKVKPVSVKKVRRGTLKIVIKEGKKHEVRVLVKRAQLKMRELKRIRIGSLTLGSLPVGSYREMTKKEKAVFKGQSSGH